MNNNVKVVIDAGHGGNDPGTSGNGLKEKDYTLLISQYMAERLKDLGYNVYLTREEDISLTPNERVNRIINAFGNNSDVLVISNHLNAGGADISNYEGLNLKKLFTTTFLIFFSTATWAWFIPANFSFWQF